MEGWRLGEAAACDCTSLCYGLLSVGLFMAGILVTAPALGGENHYLSVNLGHMWFVGPVCICSGVMLGIKNFLYLRRKQLVELLVWRALSERQQMYLREAGGGGGGGRSAPPDSGSPSLPPAYDLIVREDGPLPRELPPPTYAEAILLIDASKSGASSDRQQSPGGRSCDKD